MCMQLSARVGPSELEEFFQQVGQVKEVKMIADKNSRRSKGIAYVEFHDEKSIPGALALTGQKLFGIPIIVQMTMAEKNRLAAQAQNLMKKEGPKKLYIGSLHYNITENIIKSIFEPFGHIEKLQIMRDEAGLSKGFGFIEFREADSAERAMANLNGLELAGRPMKINHVTPEGGAGGVMMVPGAMEALDSEDFEGGGIGMTQQGRTQLMAKLAEGHNAGLSVPQVDVPAISACFMLSNMFDPSNETERNWDFDIRDDVLDECNKFGDVLHIHVDKTSPQGNVYVKCTTSRIAAAAFNSLNGRFFAGKKIVAQFIPETTYHLKFPQSVACVRPLKPST